jgi:hypothetical protein
VAKADNPLQQYQLLTRLAVELLWLPPSPDGIAMCQDGGVEGH